MVGYTHWTTGSLPPRSPRLFTSSKQRLALHNWLLFHHCAAFPRVNNWPGTSVEGNISQDIRDPPPQPSRGTCLPHGYSNSGTVRALQCQAIALPVAIVCLIWSEGACNAHPWKYNKLFFFAGVGGTRECLNIENERVKKVNDQ